MLGCAPDPTVVSWRSETSARSVVRSRVGDRDVHVYHWSPLTSGSRSFAVWPLLLPFTLVNVAGWMAPPGNGPWARRRRMLHWVGTVWVGLATTAAAVVWFFVAAMAVWQKVGGGSGNRVPGVLSGTYFAAVAASAGGATVALVLMATYTASGFERFRPHDWPEDEQRRWKLPWGEGVSSRLDDAYFYDNRVVHKARWRIHVAVAGVTFGAVVGATVFLSGTERAGHVVGRALIAVGLLQALGIAVIAVSAFGPSEDHPRRFTRRILGAATAALGVLLLGGLVLSALIAFTGIEEVPAGPVAVLYDSYGFAMLAAAGSAVLFLVVTMLTPVPAEAGAARALIPTLDARLRARLATALSNVDRVVSSLAIAFAVAATIAALVRRSEMFDETWRLTATPPVNVARSTFALVLGFTVLNLVKSRASPDSLRRIGNVWDIITFWPRAFHPFAVRPYAERAVPEIQELLRTAPRDPDTGLVVAAHSQGTILMYAAVRPSVSGNADPLPPFALVTFGSPLRALHNAVFPHYFDLADFEATRQDIPGGWVNCFRFTDHVGRAVFVTDKAAAEGYLPDRCPGEGEPADRPIADAVPPDRVVNGHNDYWAEPAIRRAVAAAEDVRVPGGRT